MERNDGHRKMGDFCESKIHSFIYFLPDEMIAFLI